ncbi:MAG TPA: hypothetical protein VK641_11060 [Terriglobales bacterium]|jgi:hypothetical protein|nr:hypothetical protein [Terriglobales bacterium]
MKVLLLHPDDRLSRRVTPGKWDLVVDFGRAPVSTYQQWSQQSRCRVVSLYDFAVEVEDLYQTKKLLQFGMGRMVDRLGIDWWDILSLHLVSDLQQVILLRRLANELSADCELYCGRPFPLATVLQKLCGGTLVNLEAGSGSAFRRLRHYSAAFSNLNIAQVIQVLQDKFDPQHAVRRRFAPRARSLGGPVVLLPSAYISVSRMAVAYAASLPDIDFLLVSARGGDNSESLPENVRVVALDSYFTATDESETSELLDAWRGLRSRIVSAASEYSAADTAGLLDRIPGLIRWGMALRTAWCRVFEIEDIVGCLCADDSNPTTRIPMILAKTNHVPALACHHGALDMWMAIKTLHADFYLAKGEMEKDYLVRVCQVPARQIIMGAPPASPVPSIEAPYSASDRPWLVFLTEAYHSAAWRSDEVYGELLPRLSSLARVCGLQLVFKVHPFESVEAHRRMLRRHVSKSEAGRIRVIAGAPSPELWRNTRFALTGQSTVAIDCTLRNIPVFLCAWLRDAFTGYVRQYRRFGIGQILDSAEQITDIPRLLEARSAAPPTKNELRQTINPEMLRELLCGTSTLPIAAQG